MFIVVITLYIFSFKGENSVTHDIGPIKSDFS